MYLGTENGDCRVGARVGLNGATTCSGRGDRRVREVHLVAIFVKILELAA